jgi:transcriptional regulator with PAS, ATPase and Fis domain
LQAKLLRVLEERQVRRVGASAYHDVDIRMVAATNVDLDAEVSKGAFRGDLFYRLNVVHFALPSLRARRGDIKLLAERFVERLTSESGRRLPELPPETMRVLESYGWPGNVRQLRNAIERAVILDVDGVLGLDDLPPEVVRGAGSTPSEGNEAILPYSTAREQALQRFRSEYIGVLLAAHGGNVSSAARAAGVSRRSLHRWIAEGGDTDLDEENAST